MRNGLLILMVSILLLPLVPGCGGGETGRMMDSADSLIVSRPEEALSILDDIPEASRSGGETEARYNMLHTEASYRALDDTILPDSAIAASVAYFSKKGDRSNAARARYNLALLKMQRKAYSAATVDLLMASDDANNSDTGHFLRGLIYRALGDCFVEFYDILTSVSYQKRAFSEFIQAENYLYGGHALSDIANRFLDLRQFDSAVYYADRSIKIGESLQDYSLCNFSQLIKATCLIKQFNHHDAIKIYEYVYPIDSARFTERDYVNWGFAYILNGEIDKARQCNTHVKNLEKAMNSIDVNILLHEGRYKECSELLISTFDILDSVRNTVWTRNDISVINDYYKSQQEESARIIDEERARRNALLVVIGLVLSLCVAVYFLVVVSLRKRLSDSMLKARALQDAITGRDSELKAANADISEMETSLTDLQERFARVSESNMQIRNNLDESRSRLESSERELRDSQSALRHSRDSIAGFEAQVSGLRDRLETIEEELESSRQELGTSRSRLEDTRKALEEAHRTGVEQEAHFARKYDEFNREIHELLRSRFELVGSLLAEKYDPGYGTDKEGASEKEETPEKREARISRCVRTELNRFVNNPDLPKELEDIINRKLDNLIGKLREDYPDFNENFISLYIYSLLKFNASAIGALQKSSLATVYTRKSKLKKRLQESDNERKELYLRYLS